MLLVLFKDRERRVSHLIVSDVNQGKDELGGWVQDFLGMERFSLGLLQAVKSRECTLRILKSCLRSSVNFAYGDFTCTEKD